MKHLMAREVKQVSDTMSHVLDKQARKSLMC